MESDCLKVINALNSGIRPHLDNGVMLKDIVFTADFFEHIEFSFVSRNYNVVAHHLAKLAITMPGWGMSRLELKMM